MEALCRHCDGDTFSQFVGHVSGVDWIIFVARGDERTSERENLSRHDEQELRHQSRINEQTHANVGVLGPAEQLCHRCDLGWIRLE